MNISIIVKSIRLISGHMKKANEEMYMKIWLGLMSILFSLNVTAQSYLNFEKISDEKSPIFIELYSSQGCSSCPPAEEWLSSFVDNGELWNTYFPVSFHVTYWNYLGWKDPFSDRRYSQRQYDHLSLLNIRQVYTPQFVVNSSEWRGWFNRDYDSLKQIKREKAPKLNLEIKSGKVTAILDDSVAVDSSYKFHLAIVGSGFSTKVTRGENRSKQLKQDFTVLDVQTFTRGADSTFSGSVKPLPKISIEAKRLAWVGWVEHKGKVVQAVGDWIEQ